MTFAGSAASAVTPHDGQIGARSTSGGLGHATTKSLRLRHASPPSTSTSTRPGGLLSIRAVTEEEIDVGLDRLAALIREELDRPGRQLSARA